jgi:hypothetical protein
MFANILNEYEANKIHIRLDSQLFLFAVKRIKKVADTAYPAPTS